jgi:hypothetical protein
MIYARPYDAGTVVTHDDANEPPGMDRVYWREADLEENIGENKAEQINRAMMDPEPVELRPWPELFPAHAWIDWTDRYQADGDEGLRLEVHSVDSLGGRAHPTPAGVARFTTDPQPLVEPTEERIQRAATWQEVQGLYGPDWLRLDTKNETGGTRLKAPLALNFGRLRGTGFRLVLPDNSLFAPFDLTHPERYHVTDEDGRHLAGDHWLDLAPRGHYNLYFRPRRWRYVAVVIAHYWIVSGFESFPADEVFTRSHYDRPPFYPYRHNYPQSAASTSYQNYFGFPRSYDQGITEQWNMSRNAGALRLEIMEGQIYTLCWAKIFIGNEDADVALYRIAPRAADVVLGIGRVDPATGSESRVWVHQLEDAAAWYPDKLLGQYLVPFAVAN